MYIAMTISLDMSTASYEQRDGDAMTGWGSTDPRRLGLPIVRMGTTTSTMDIVRRLGSYGATEGITVIAANQTAGRGRAGRSWISTAGSGLYFSILLRPGISPERFRSFSLAVGLALCDALDPDGVVSLQLKWPNDILYRDRKLAGILVTSILAGNLVESAILGIGLNLLPDPARPANAVSLAEIPAARSRTRDDLFRSIVDAIALRYTSIVQHDPGSALAGWQTRLAWLDRPVTIHDGSADRTGYLRGIDEHGALLLDTKAGSMTITTGELARGPRLQRPEPRIDTPF